MSLLEEKFKENLASIQQDTLNTVFDFLDVKSYFKMRRVTRFFKSEIDENPLGYQRRINNDVVPSLLLIDMPLEDEFIHFCMTIPSLANKFPAFKRTMGPQEGYFLYGGFFIQYEMDLSYEEVKILYNFFQNFYEENHVEAHGQIELYFDTLVEPFISLHYQKEIISEELY